MRAIRSLAFACCVACSSSGGTVGGAPDCPEAPETKGYWSPMALPPANVGALLEAFAWTGDELLVWGGVGLHTENGGCVPCNGGGAYDPKSNSWRALSSVGAPTARESAPGVWTGKYFVTWGGRPIITRTPTSKDSIGGIYDLATDVWKALPTSNQPEWRWQHDLVWTGREVLVWGGANWDNVNLCDGGRFDPEQGTWSPMSLAGAPSGCAGPAVAWTGKELLVWGGDKAGISYELTNTGAVYDPELDSWRTMSTVGAPAARARAAVVWTGQEMIVFGGNVGVDARAYNPTTDTWRSLSLVGAPALHTRGDAVWTGSEMIVWGHSDCDVGGRYDLASDTWKLFSSKGSLSARAEQTLVWTGEDMLVYGGTVGTHFTQDTNSGARYRPPL